MTIARIGPDGWLRAGGRAAPARLGRSGILAAESKREGDGGTPAGFLPLRRVLYRPDRLTRPSARVAVEPLDPTAGWCDDPAHPSYNQPVTLPFPASHEVLWRSDALYDVIGVLGWNDAPVLPGRGSAIFLHVAGEGATEGCIALALPPLLELLASLEGIEVTR